MDPRVARPRRERPHRRRDGRSRGRGHLASPRGWLAWLLVAVVLEQAGCSLPSARPAPDAAVDGPSEGPSDTATDPEPDAVADRVARDEGGDAPDAVIADGGTDDATADAPDKDLGPELPFCDPEDPDLYGCYQFERGEAPSPFDESIYGNHGSESGLIYADDGIVGTALQLAATPILLPLMRTLDDSPAWSAELWLNPDVLPEPGVYSQVIDQDAGWAISLETGGDLDCCVPTSEVTAPCARAKGLFWPGAWRHVACTYDGEMVRLYVGGQLRDAVPATGTVTSQNLQYGVGYDEPQGGSYFRGRIDQFRLWRRALTGEEICASARVAPGDCDVP